jgi:hypothetical protein
MVVLGVGCIVALSVLQVVQPLNIIPLMRSLPPCGKRHHVSRHPIMTISIGIYFEPRRYRHTTFALRKHPGVLSASPMPGGRKVGVTNANRYVFVQRLDVSCRFIIVVGVVLVVWTHPSTCHGGFQRWLTYKLRQS